MNRRKIVALIMASAMAFNTISSISNVNVLAYESQIHKNLIIEEEIPQSQMTAVATSSQSGEDGSKAIDGDISTMWHTPWYETIEFPQSLTIDLGGVNNVSSLKVSPRVSGSNGMINNYEVYAINGDEETLVSEGVWATSNSDPKYVTFNEPINAEKIKIVALGGVGGFASIAEVNIYRVKEDINKIARYENKKITNNQGIDISSDIEALKGLEEGTIVARFDTTKGDIQSLISVGNNNVANGHFHLYVADNTVGFEVRNQSGNVATGKASAVLNNGINTVALKVTSGVGYKIFINGKLAGEVTTSNATLSAGVVDVNNAYIGKTDRASGNEYPFSGSIDFIDVYGDVLPDKYLLDVTGQTVLPSEDEILPEGYKSEVVDLFKPGDLGSPNFRIPALFTTKEGTVIASIDVRNNGGADAPWNDIDSGVKRKTVNGEWEEAQKVIDFPSNASVIDTALTQDEETGRIFLLVTTFPQNYGFWQAQAGSGYTEIDGEKYRSLYDSSGNLYTIREDGNVYDNEGNITDYNVNIHSMELTKGGVSAGNVMTANCELKVHGTSYLSLIYSDDDGKTWSEPIDINADVKADWMKFLGTGPGAGIQMKNGEHAGRIVFPVYYTNEIGGKQSSAVIYSDDHGATWEIGESPNDGRDLGNGSFGNSQTMTDGLELTECQVVEMPNGQLKLFMRNTGSYVRIATSFDGGATWDADVYEDRNLPEPYCQLSVINYSKQIDGKDAIVFANPAGSGRSNGTVRFGLISENGTHENGQTKYEFEWKYNKLVKAGTYAYSCLTELANGDIGLFYEGTGNQEMSYMEMSSEYIKFDYEASLEELVNPGKIESIELLDGNGSYDAGDEINVKLTFDQAVSLVGNKNLTLKLGENEVILNPVSENNAREFTFEGVLPTTLEEGTFNLVLKANEDTEILNTIGKNITLSSDIDLSNNGGQIVIGGGSIENPDETIKPLVGYSNIRISNNSAYDISSDLNSFKDLTEGTIIARFDNTNKTGVQSIIGIGNDTDRNSHFHLYTFGDKVGFELRNQTQEGATESGTTNIARPSANVTLNEGINTIAFKVTNGEGYKIFVNGVLVLNVEDTNARFLDAIEDANKAYIGKTPRHSSATNMYSFNGDVDFVEIYGTTLEDEVLLNKTAETTLVSDLETAISSVEIIDEKEEYVAGDRISFNLKFNQAVSLVGETNLTLMIGDVEVPITIVKGDTASNFVFEATLPEEVSSGNQELVLKANENTTILNTAGNNITVSTNVELNKSINIDGAETPELEQAGINMTVAEEVTVGNDFDINVNLSDIKENMYAMEFEVDYDETKVDFKEAT
ncbi:exo-alpha-sialidase, partial [Clostridium celatum]|uniref:sialidase domain-containing protein n=2 Tax=Clostridium celatum TaxID=36834 RepID=UPI001F41916E